MLVGTGTQIFLFSGIPECECGYKCFGIHLRDAGIGDGAAELIEVDILVLLCSEIFQNFQCLSVG